MFRPIYYQNNGWYGLQNKNPIKIQRRWKSDKIKDKPTFNILFTLSLRKYYSKTGN